MLKDRLDQEIKTALLAGDKFRVTVLRGLKSALLYEAVQFGVKDQGLSDEQITTVLQRESKKRTESIELYKKGGDEQRAKQESDEKAIIDSFLPEPLSEAELQAVVDEQIAKLGATSMQDMGKVIAAVRTQAAGRADGAAIARLVKDYLGK